MTDHLPDHVNLLIVGASYAGLTMARTLSRQFGSNLSIALLDRAPIKASGKTDPRASALSAGSINLFRRLGLWEELEQNAQPVRQIDITDPIGDSPLRQILLSYDNDVDGNPASWIVENAHLRAALQQSVLSDPNIATSDGAAVTAWQPGSSGTVITLDNGKAIRADLVIAADGAASRLRNLAGIKTTGWAYDQTGIVATIRHTRPHDAIATQHFLPAGPFAILPLQGNRASIVWTENAEIANTLKSADNDKVTAVLQDRLGSRLGTCTLDGPYAFWPLKMSLSRRLSGPRLALIGDAARTVHPIAGQGFNLAIRDIAALTDTIRDAVTLGIDPGNAEMLSRYEQQRRFDAMTSALAFDALNRLFSNNNALLRSVRDAGLELVGRSPMLKSFFVREAAGLTGGDIPSLMQPIEKSEAAKPEI